MMNEPLSPCLFVEQVFSYQIKRCRHLYKLKLDVKITSLAGGLSPSFLHRVDLYKCINPYLEESRYKLFFDLQIQTVSLK